MLGRDFLGSARNTYQHQCLVRRQGYLIDPTISKAIALSEKHTAGAEPTHIAIADVGTRNGIWAVETCASLDSIGRAYTMTAFDMSDGLFTPRQTWPKHCTFDVWNISDEVPEKYVAKFDIVHARLLLAVIMTKPAAVREQVARNLASLVKPGGWLQWQEPPPPIFAEVDLHDDGTCTFKKDTLPPEAAVAKHLPMVQAPWIHNIADLVKSVTGFEEVKSYYPPPKREYLRYENDLHAWNWNESIEELRRTGAMSPEVVDEVSAVWEAFEPGLKSGKTLVAMQTIIVIGRKPFNASA